MVHEVAVGAALAVWALGICGVTVKFSIDYIDISKLLLGQPSHTPGVLDRLQLHHVGLPVFAGVHKHQSLQQLLGPTVTIHEQTMVHFCSQNKI